MNNIIETEHKLFFQTYKRLPIVIDRAVGCYIYDKEGNEWLDFLGGIAVNSLGHSHPRIIEAIEKQIKKYMHVSNYFYQDAQVAFAEKLFEFTGYSRVFLSNSGTEATEGAIKLARRWGHDINKTNIIAFSGGFHGRTYGALSIMDKPLYKEKMGPYLQNTQVIDYNSVEELEKAVNEQTLAVVLEFVQGEGGITTATKECVAKINELKEKYGFLVISDEIQAGTGRTGKFFAFEHFDIKPDIITLAKGVGGGLPLGCILASESLANVWEKAMHGTTFGGNAVACSAGSAVLDELKNGLLDEVVEKGEYFDRQLNKIKEKYKSLVLEVRGIGFIKGLLLSFPSAELVDELLKLNIIANAASGTVLRMVPPLVATKVDIDRFILGLDKALSKFC